MRWLVLVLALLPTLALAQAMLPLTGWRAQIDVDLGKIQMSRDAHGQVIAILQAYERQAQAAKEDK